MCKEKKSSAPKSTIFYAVLIFVTVERFYHTWKNFKLFFLVFVTDNIFFFFFLCGRFAWATKSLDQGIIK